MEFFYSQESLTIIQWILRAVFAYIILLIAVKLLGQRSISQLRLLDFIIAIILGNILAHPLSDEGLGMTGSITTTFSLVVLYILSLLIKLRFKVVEKFFSPAPIPIVKNGEIIYQNLVKAKIPLDFLLSELRLQQIADIKKVAAAFWEPGGKISVFMVSSHQPLTPSDMQLVPPPFSLPTIVIKEGDIDLDALNKIDRTKDWLTDLLKNTYNAEAKDILMATVDDSYSLQVFYK
ncbi:DUF421 domain-containing protein [Wukongibacter baidiensis]|uniref:DUF421 domain-containing protein n=1 Tax=Wukongibacter baidiensis TaxID=1723361 RepID=UPI003D7FABD1